MEQDSIKMPRTPSLNVNLWASHFVGIILFIFLALINNKYLFGADNSQQPGELSDERILAIIEKDIKRRAERKATSREVQLHDDIQDVFAAVNEDLSGRLAAGQNSNKPSDLNYEEGSAINEDLESLARARLYSEWKNTAAKLPAFQNQKAQLQIQALKNFFDWTLFLVSFPQPDIKILPKKLILSFGIAEALSSQIPEAKAKAIFVLALSASAKQKGQILRFPNFCKASLLQITDGIIRKVPKK
ncbi:MAG: hypothetical protein JWQ35_34 [Bacteriovoracaceae bacterium]|nr:hypothetical protein [Bacteriovoracaceae bacterium]